MPTKITQLLTEVNINENDIIPSVGAAGEPQLQKVKPDQLYEVFAKTGTDGQGNFTGKVVRQNINRLTYPLLKTEQIQITVPPLHVDPDWKYCLIDGTFLYIFPGGTGVYPDLSNYFIKRIDLLNFSTIETLDLKAINPLLRGFSGGFSNGEYLFLIPHGFDYNRNGGLTTHGYFTRINLDSFNSASYLDLALTDQSLVMYKHGFTDGIFGYLIGDYNYSQAGYAPFTKINLKNFTLDSYFDLGTIDSKMDDSDDSVTNGKYGILLKKSEGYVTRVNLNDISDAQVITYPMDSAYETQLLLADNKYIYLLYWKYNAIKKIVRIDIEKFSLNEIDEVDLAPLGLTNSPDKGLTDGKYAYFYNTGSDETEVIRIDLDNFNESSIEVIVTGWNWKRDVCVDKDFIYFLRYDISGLALPPVEANVLRMPLNKSVNGGI